MSDNLGIESESAHTKMSETELIRNIRSSKEYLKGNYPFVTFDTDRDEPLGEDEETNALLIELKELGQMSKSHATPEDILDLRQKWMTKVKDKLGRGEPIIFDIADLDHLDLRELDLRGISLRNVNFEGSNLTGSNLSGDSVMMCNFQGAILDGTSFENAIAVNSNFRNASLRGADIRGVFGNFAFADFSGARIIAARLDPRAFYNSSFSGATIKDCHPGNDVEYPITPPKTTLADFEDALSKQALSSNPERDGQILLVINSLIKLASEYLKTKGSAKTELDIALYNELRELGLLNPNLPETEIKLRRLKWREKWVKLEKPANFDGMDLSGLDLTGIVLSGVSLIGANLEGTNLTWANLSGTNTMLANFRGANLHLTDLRGSFSIGTDFSNATLTAPRARETVFLGAKFQGANIAFADFKRCVLLGTDFEDAEIDESSFTQSSNLEALKKAKLSGYIVYL